MADYYVSEAGDDSNSGTLNSPWKTVARAKAAVLTEGVLLKNRILFRRGDTFYGNLSLAGAGTLASDSGWLRFGAYGDSDQLPVLSGYKVLNSPSAWVRHDADTWKLNYAAQNYGATYTGCSEPHSLGQDINNVGFLKIDGVIFGRGYQSMEKLKDQWDFYCDPDETQLYVRSLARPTDVAGDIRASYGLNGIDGQPSGMEFADLTLEGFGNCGVAVGGCERVRVLRCTIREIGGVYGPGFSRYPGTTPRVGNGIQAFNNTRNFYCEYNTIHDLYDSAWTIQGGKGPYRDITFRRNFTYRVTQGEDYTYWGSGQFFENCLSEHNTIMFCGYNWGSDHRSFTNFFYRGVGQETFQYGDGVTPGDVTIRRNIYYDMRTAFCHWAYPPLGLNSDYNLIWLRPSVHMEDQRTAPPRPPNLETAERAATWALKTGRELHSRIGVLPSIDRQVITDGDVRSALNALNGHIPMGQVVTIHGPWIR